MATGLETTQVEADRRRLGRHSEIGDRDPVEQDREAPRLRKGVQLQLERGLGCGRCACRELESAVRSHPAIASRGRILALEETAGEPGTRVPSR